MNSKQKITIKLVKITAEYIQTFHFKIKFGFKQSKEQLETTGSYKYEKGTSGSDINESIELPIDNSSPQDLILQFCLQIYTKTGYKTAGAGEVPFNTLLSTKQFQVEFLKCPLGKGSIEGIIIQGDSTTNDQPKPNPKPKSSVEDIGKYKKKIDDLNEELAQSLKDNEGLLGQVDKLKTELNNTKTQLTQAQAMNKTQALSSSSSGGNSNYKVNEQLKDKEKIIEELKTQNAYFDEENSELKGIVNDLKAEKKKVFDEKNNIIKKQKEQIEALNDQLSSIQYKLDEFTNDKQKLNAEASQLSKNNDSIKTQYEDKIKHLNDKTSSLTNTINQLEQDLQLSNDQLTGLKTSLTAKESEYKSILLKEQERFNQKEQEIIKKYQTLVGDKDLQLIKITNDLQEKEEQISSLETDLEISRQANQDKALVPDVNKDLSAKDSTIRQLKDQLEYMTAEKDKYEKQVKSAELDQDSHYEMSKSTEKKLKEDLIKLRSILDTKRAEVQKLHDENTSLKQEIERNNNEVKESESNQLNNADFINKIQDMQKSFNERETKIANEKYQEIQALKKENESLKLQIKKSSSTMDNSKYLNEITRLQEQKTSLEEDLNYYKELNMKFVDAEKKSLILENDNASLRSLLNKANVELNEEKKNRTLMKETLEFELINTKEKMAELVNELTEAEMRNLSLSNREITIEKTDGKKSKKK